MSQCVFLDDPPLRHFAQQYAPNVTKSYLLNSTSGSQAPTISSISAAAAASFFLPMAPRRPACKLSGNIWALKILRTSKPRKRYGKDMSQSEAPCSVPSKCLALLTQERHERQGPSDLVHSKRFQSSKELSWLWTRQAFLWRGISALAAVPSLSNSAWPEPNRSTQHTL